MGEDGSLTRKATAAEALLVAIEAIRYVVILLVPQHCGDPIHGQHPTEGLARPDRRRKTDQERGERGHAASESAAGE